MRSNKGVKELASSTCELCEANGGETLWEDASCRVVLVADDDYPGFCRVIAQQHVREMTDLDRAAREHMMHVVFATEQALRTQLHPVKINLASLGNLVPHLHWHVIARFEDDRHFPNAIWGEARRPGRPHALDARALRLALHQALRTVAE